MGKSEERKLYVEANWATMRTIDIAKNLDISEKTVQKISRQIGLSPKSAKDRIYKEADSSFQQALIEAGHTNSKWSHGWLKTKVNVDGVDKDVSVFQRNENGGLDLEEILNDIFEKYFKGTPTPIRITPTQSESFDRLVITDIHIGLDPNKSGNSMYPMKWGVDEINLAKEKIINEVLLNKKSDILYIDNLGDYLDGYEAQTTRGKHHLDQCLNTAQQFSVGVEFMIDLFNVFCREYKYVYYTNITNDNHAGNFGLICGIAIKQLAELKFNNIEVYNQEKFIEHYKRGNHLFLLCHGKDKSLMRYGFLAVPNKDNIHKVENYISTNRLNNYGEVFIEFSKGDSHIYNADMGSSDLFTYISYPTLAPNSEYITTNFKKGTRGFVFHNISYKERKSSIHPIYL